MHTFAGHEQKVIGALRNIIKSRELEDQIYEIYLPEEDVTEFKSGKKVTVSKRMFPSYLLIRCEPDPEIFYVIGSTPGVTGFVGAEKTRPTALTRREVDNIIRPHVEGVEVPQAKRRMPTHEFEVNDTVQIKTGPFAHVLGPRGRDQRRPVEGQGAGGHLRTRDPGGARLHPGHQALERQGESHG